MPTAWGKVRTVDENSHFKHFKEAACWFTTINASIEVRMCLNAHRWVSIFSDSMSAHTFIK